MMPKMPRGAIPISRSDLAASNPYRPDPAAQVFVPSGKFPSPNHELAVTEPYRGGGAAPESFLLWPEQMSDLGDERADDSMWAEEAFAKACADPGIVIPTEAVLSTAKECGSSNFAQFLQTHGFQVGGKSYLDGQFHSIDWKNAATVNSAIANVGPVKIGIASANLNAGAHGQVTPGKSGWAVYGLPTGQPGDHCVSLCGFGSLAVLADLFTQRGVTVDLPAGMPAGLCYAMFTRGSIGIIDSQSLMNVTGEAWVRTPTTIVKDTHA